jgi:hypothetical protein
VLLAIAFVLFYLWLAIKDRKYTERKSLDDAEKWRQYKEAHGTCACPKCMKERLKKVMI